MRVSHLSFTTKACLILALFLTTAVIVQAGSNFITYDAVSQKFVLDNNVQIKGGNTSPANLEVILNGDDPTVKNSTFPIILAHNYGNTNPQNKSFFAWTSEWGSMAGGIRASTAGGRWGTQIYGEHMPYTPATGSEKLDTGKVLSFNASGYSIDSADMIIIDGKVGIGTTPGYKLSVTDTGNVPIINIWNNSTTNYWTGIRLARGGAGSGGEKWFIGMNDSNDNFRIKGFSSNDLVIDINTGNVGIGIATPVNKLQINGGNLHMNGNSIFLKNNPTDQYDVIKWSGAADDKIDIGGFKGVNLGYTSTGGPNAITPVLTVTQGNVGIGTTAPGAKLEVDVASGSNAIAINGGTKGPTETTYLSVQYNRALFGYDGIRQAGAIIAGSGKSIVFDNNSFERMRIDSAGKVGIGTNNPAVTLDVNGRIKVGEQGTVQALSNIGCDSDHYGELSLCNNSVGNTGRICACTDLNGNNNWLWNAL